MLSSTSTPQSTLQSTTKYEKPPVAVASLRSHAFPVTTLAFSLAHDPLPSIVTGDEGGWVFWWSLTSRRLLAVWKPHDKSITKVEFITSSSSNGLENDSNGSKYDRRLLTHGRDNKIKVFRLDLDLQTLDTDYIKDLPTQSSDPKHYKTPWMIHSQDVNALNFCGAAIHDNCIAVPNTLSSEQVDIYTLWPEFHRPYFAIDPAQYTINSHGNLNSNLNSQHDGQKQHGIVMSLILTRNRLVVGYESGEVFVYAITLDRDSVEKQGQPEQPELISCSKIHSQPILSLCHDLNSNTFLSTSAHSLIVKHDLTTGAVLDQVDTKHSGLADVSVRSDGRIFATAGWDGYIRVFEYSSMGLLSSFRAGRQQGVTCVGFACTELTAESSPESSVSLSRQLKKAQATHWTAVGGKDGRIALYDLY